MAIKAIPSVSSDDLVKLRGAKGALAEVALKVAGSIEELRAQKQQVDEEARDLRDRHTARAGRTSEENVANAVLRLLAEASVPAISIQELQEQLPKFLHLTDADLAQSVTRPNESVWVQQIRNIVSHRTISGNAINEGLLTYVAPGKIGITEKGKGEVEREGANG